MWSVNNYLTQGPAEQQEFPNRAGDRPQITYMHKMSLSTREGSHGVLQEELGGF